MKPSLKGPDWHPCHNTFIWFPPIMNATDFQIGHSILNQLRLDWIIHWHWRVAIQRYFGQQALSVIWGVLFFYNNDHFRSSFQRKQFQRLVAFRMCYIAMQWKHPVPFIALYLTIIYNFLHISLQPCYCFGTV